MCQRIGLGLLLLPLSTGQPAPPRPQSCLSVVHSDFMMVSILKPAHLTDVGIIACFLAMCRPVIALCPPAGLLAFMDDPEVFSGVGVADQDMNMRVCFIPVQGRNPHQIRKLILGKDDDVLGPIPDII